MNALKAAMREKSRRYGQTLERIPEEAWPDSVRFTDHRVTEVWRSRHFLLIAWQQGDYERLTINRAALVPGSSIRFTDAITWDDLQRLKAECGRGDCWAVELFPADAHLVNVQNMRHLFVLREAPDYAWK